MLSTNIYFLCLSMFSSFSSSDPSLLVGAGYGQCLPHCFSQLDDGCTHHSFRGADQVSGVHALTAAGDSSAGGEGGTAGRVIVCGGLTAKKILVCCVSRSQS